MRAGLLRWCLAACVPALLAACAASPSSEASRQRSDALLERQLAQARQALAPGQPPRIVFAGFALHSESKAFRGDVERAAQVMRRIDPQAVEVRMSNPVLGQDADWPFATPENVGTALLALGNAARPGDKVVVLFASHGSPQSLAVRAGNSDLPPIGVTQLQHWLAPLRGKPTLIVLSACYSGSFVPALRGPSRIIFTAAAADRSSFGCQFHSGNTFFGQELWPEGDLAGLTLMQLMDRAREGVRKREEAMNATPSQPQSFYGPAVEPWARQPLSQWLDGRTP